MTVTAPSAAASTATARGAAACTAGMVMVGTSIAISPTLVNYPVLAGQAWRYLAAGVVLMGLLVSRGERLRRLRLEQWLRLAALAATGLAAFNWFVIEGAMHADPALLAAVVGAVPIVLAVLGPMLARTGVRPLTVAGALVVGVGIVVVSGATAAPLAAVPYAVGIVMCEVLFTLLAVPLLEELSPLELSAAVCFVAVPMLALAALAEPGPKVAIPTPTEGLALLYMAVITTAVAFLLWYDGVIRLGPDRAGLFAGVMPVAGSVAGMALGTSETSSTSLAGALLCGLGVAIGMRSGRNRDISEHTRAVSRP